MAESIPGGLYAVKDTSGKVLRYVDAKNEEIAAEKLPEGVKKPDGGTAISPTATRTPAASDAGEATFGELPAGYPGAQAFVAAGLTTRAAIEGRSDKDLTDLKDIGTATVAKVREFAKNNPLPGA